MSGIYWYISSAKLKILKESYSRRIFTRRLSTIKLKLAWAEAEVSSQSIEELVRDVEKIKKSINAKIDIEDFQNLTKTQTPIFFNFSGSAARLVNSESYWIATERDNVALLLAGSPAHAIGMQPKTIESLSPSLDPVGAVHQAFQQTGDSVLLSKSLSYAWQEIMRQYTRIDSQLPKVEGLGVFAGMFPTNKAQMRRVKRENIQYLVVGSPVYIKQIGSDVG